MSILLGISGHAGSGKDTVANWLVEDFNFCKISLADPIKRFLKEIYEFTDEQLWGSSELRSIPDIRFPRNDGTFLSPREILQKLGTDCCRSCYPNTWIDYTIKIVKQLLDESNNFMYDSKIGLYRVNNKSPKIGGVVIPDIRFRNEFEAIRKADGKIIRILRPNKNNLNIENANHQSEIEQENILNSEFDKIIYNNKTLDELKYSIKNIFN